MGKGRIGGVQFRGANTGAFLRLCMVVVVVGVVARADHSSQRPPARDEHPFAANPFDATTRAW